MKIGLLLPQGYFNEFEGWTPTAAWERVLEVARLGERLGFDSLWTGEHVLAKWDPEGFAFDCVTLHTAVAAAVPRVDIGFGVINSTFRNPAMTAKMASTLDTISGGRADPRARRRVQGERGESRSASRTRRSRSGWRSCPSTSRSSAG